MNLIFRATKAAVELFSGVSGLKLSVESLHEERRELRREASFEIDTTIWNAKLNDRIPANRSPRISIGAMKIVKRQEERLNENSAVVTLAMELVCTHERLDNLHAMTSDWVDAICDVLNRNQGLWAQGVFYAGAYVASVAPVARGGLNYLQSATVTIELHIWQV